MAVNKAVFSFVDNDDLEELINNMRPNDYTELMAAKEGRVISTAGYLQELVKDCDMAYVCKYNKRVLFASGLSKHADTEGLGVFWLLTTKEVEKHKIAYAKAVKTLFSKYLAYCYKGIYTHIMQSYSVAIKAAEILGFKKVGEEVLDNTKHFIYILLGDNVDGKHSI